MAPIRHGQPDVVKPGRAGVVLAGAALGAGLAWATGRPRVTGIAGMTRCVADLAVSQAFYLRLGFSAGRHRSLAGPAHAALMGVPGLVSHCVTMALGDQRLELACRSPGGHAGAGAAAVAANSTGFQHCAVVVSDIDEAWDALGTVTPIGQFGPQLLPGGVAAVKFRDPDGHPLELLQFPPGGGRAMWRLPGDRRLFRGIDHSAITVGATQASIAFYRDVIGLRVSSRGLNQGPAQQALDGVRAPLVRVTQLRPAEACSMRIELLGYLSPPPPQPARPGRSGELVPDLAPDQLVLVMADLDAACARLVGADARFVSPGVVAGQDGRALLVADPDGHHLLLTD